MVSFYSILMLDGVYSWKIMYELHNIDVLLNSGTWLAWVHYNEDYLWNALDDTPEFPFRSLEFL